MKRTTNYLVDLVFPYRCVLCSVYLEKNHLCTKCFNSLPIKKQFECVGCKRPTPMGKTCAFCRDENQLDQLFIVSDFKDIKISSLIKLFKYRFLADLAGSFMGLTSKYLKHIAERDHFSIVQNNPLFIPVPLHKTREFWRGFNQAELLAQKIAKHYQVETSQRLKRANRGIPQAELEDRPERLLNVLGMYQVIDSDRIKGRSIYLIDDVCTTGATLNECARVLKEAGAIHVAALVIARG